MYSLYDHPRNFKFMQNYQQYGPFSVSYDYDFLNRKRFNIGFVIQYFHHVCKKVVVLQIFSSIFLLKWAIKKIIFGMVRKTEFGAFNPK